MPTSKITSAGGGLDTAAGDLRYVKQDGTTTGATTQAQQFTKAVGQANRGACRAFLVNLVQPGAAHQHQQQKLVVDMRQNPV